MNASKSASPRGNPNLAAVLTWFLPGAGHVYIGRPLFGFLAFVLIEGSYFLGLRMSDGRLFEYLEPELQGLFAGALAPEVGNLGALVWHMKTYAFGPGFPRPWPDHMHLGTWLTATSGLLNVCLMVRVHLEARIGKAPASLAASPDLQILAGWLFPGLGHLLQKRIPRAVVVFVILVGLFVLGTILAQGSNLDRERHFYYWAGQFLIGVPGMLLEALHGHARIQSEIPYVDAGLVMVCLAGLLNVLALLDVYAHAETRLLGKAKAPWAPGTVGAAGNDAEAVA